MPRHAVHIILYNDNPRLTCTYFIEKKSRTCSRVISMPVRTIYTLFRFFRFTESECRKITPTSIKALENARVTGID